MWTVGRPIYAIPPTRRGERHPERRDGAACALLQLRDVKKAVVQADGADGAEAKVGEEIHCD